MIKFNFVAIQVNDNLRNVHLVLIGFESSLGLQFYVLSTNLYCLEVWITERKRGNKKQSVNKIAHVICFTNYKIDNSRLFQLQ